MTELEVTLSNALMQLRAQSSLDIQDVSIKLKDGKVIRASLVLDSLSDSYSFEIKIPNQSPQSFCISVPISNFLSDTDIPRILRGLDYDFDLDTKHAGAYVSCRYQLPDRMTSTQLAELGNELMKCNAIAAGFDAECNMFSILPRERDYFLLSVEADSPMTNEACTLSVTGFNGYVTRRYYSEDSMAPAGYELIKGAANDASKLTELLDEFYASERAGCSPEDSIFLPTADALTLAEYFEKVLGYPVTVFIRHIPRANTNHPSMSDAFV